ncbi:putative WPP domain-interacting tail-anchored protein [Helianthus annuus]|uniref:Putative WPP domain-interacting protein 2 n=1 Tax=Helianthus annuus TaxID=4232 RepID=A0A251UCJ0_HELAN|nr:WPP domain-interacting tail-anchored protein 1 [Helianthus annuus]XP_035831229.1 WPP domain-interacting tail-anchored protein 1 [Helianthus annuus]KAF5799879.1 putative WPP domain-interacting tail-anchored protein [Helianthus annuus]KAJ0732300.1 putative WPP domain-interacting tail-anchored protein [Helianthus annuus]
MDATASYNASSPLVSFHSGGSESDINKSSLSVKTSRDSESTVEIITRFKLDIACICEKLANLNLLSMHVETMENDFKAFVSDTDPDLIIKIVEYDLLSGFLDSETRILETHISDLQKEKDNVREFLSSRESVIGMEEMLHDSEKSLEQSLEQVSEIKIRSANFEKNLLRFSGDEDYVEVLNSNDVLELEKMKMKTVEHQRHVLRMLEKSLEREIDLEKRASDLTQVEETLTMRLRLLEQEVVDAEEEAETTLEKFYKTDHASELLMQTTKELIRKIKMLQFNLKGSIQRETGLKNDLTKLQQRVIDEKESSKRIAEMENVIIEAENRAVNYEDTRRELNDTCEKVVLLEKELGDVRVKLQHAEACCEASEEEKSMFLSTIKDMGNVIDDLKKKVTESEILTDSVEDRCIILSEANADLKKELKFVKGKVKSLETSLRQMEETKKASAKDINLCSKFITDLVMQMQLERERLQKQISSLKQENKILVNCLNKDDKDPSVKVSYGDKVNSNDITAENKEAVSTNFEVEECTETVTDYTEAARDIDARQLKTKDILLVLLILIVPLIGVLVYQTQV